MFDWICRAKVVVEDKRWGPYVVSAWTRSGAAKKAAVAAAREAGHIFNIEVYEVSVQRGKEESSYETAERFRVYVRCALRAAFAEIRL